MKVDLSIAFNCYGKFCLIYCNTLLSVNKIYLYILWIVNWMIISVYCFLLVIFTQLYHLFSVICLKKLFCSFTFKLLTSWCSRFAICKPHISGFCCVCMESSKYSFNWKIYFFNSYCNYIFAIVFNIFILSI